MTTYLLLSSSTRDRLLYPNPADFVVPFQTIHSTTANLSTLNTSNPISVFAIYNFCWTNYTTSPLRPQVFSTRIVGGGGNNIKVDINVNRDLLGLPTRALRDPPGPPIFVRQTIENCVDVLKSYTLRINGQESLIMSYSPIYSTIQIADNLSFQIGDICEIVNLSNLDNAADNTSEIILNGTYELHLALEKNLHLYNVNLNEIRPCTYDNFSNKLTCIPSFSPHISYKDKYLLFNKTFPSILGELLPFPNRKYYLEKSSDRYNFRFPGQGYKIGEKVMFLENKDNVDKHCSVYSVRRTGFHGDIQELELIEMGCQQFNRASCCFVVPLDRRQDLLHAVIFIEDISTAFRCKIKNPQHQIFRPNDFVGNYFQCMLLSPLFTVSGGRIYVSPNSTLPVPIPGDAPLDLRTSQEESGVFSVTSVSFLSKEEVIIFVQKVSPNLLARLDLFQTLSPEIKNNEAYQGALHINILPFQNEGVVPLNFTGTYLTQSQMSCYEMTVLNLILPNVQINSLNSLLTSGYPYILLEVSNVTLPSAHNKNAIYSNNPASINSTFVCSISDVNDPLRTKFIKISSDGTVQTLKFSPADNLRVRILLPSGETFRIQENDFLPPSIVNPRLQIEVLLEIKRV